MSSRVPTLTLLDNKTEKKEIRAQFSSFITVILWWTNHHAALVTVLSLSSFCILFKFPPLLSLSSPPILLPRVQPSHTRAFFLALHTKYKNVKPAVLGMLPKETVLLKILFLPKYFQSIWRGVKPQWLSVVFPFTISPGTPSTALSNRIFFQEKKKKEEAARDSL